MRKSVALFIFSWLAFQSADSTATELPEWLEGKSENAVKGFNLYVDKGCALCHGYLGQGSPMSGPGLISSLPYEFVRLNVRQPRNQMPLYLEETLSDRQLRLIVEYINALPERPNPDQIELLKNWK